MSDQEPVAIDVEVLINRFGMEIGMLRGQAIVEEQRMIAERDAWAAEKKSLLEKVTALHQRVTELENATSGDKADKPPAKSTPR